MVGQQSEQLWGPKMLLVVSSAQYSHMYIFMHMCIYIYIHIPNLHSVAGVEKVKEGCFPFPLPHSRSIASHKMGPSAPLLFLVLGFYPLYWDKGPEPSEKGKARELLWQLALQPPTLGMPQHRARPSTLPSAEKQLVRA